MTELEVAQAEETASLTIELEQAGYPERVARAQLRRLGDQQKRAHRHARTELLLEGITALETVYRDALAGPDARRAERRPPDARRSTRVRCAAALDACRAARQVLIEHNPNETLLLERLLLHLPAGALTEIARRLRRTPRRYTHSPRRSSSDGRAAHS